MMTPITSDVSVHYFQQITAKLSRKDFTMKVRAVYCFWLLSKLSISSINNSKNYKQIVNVVHENPIITVIGFSLEKTLLQRELFYSFLETKSVIMHLNSRHCFPVVDF